MNDLIEMINQIDDLEVASALASHLNKRIRELELGEETTDGN